jgi:hypothetical protein
MNQALTVATACLSLLLGLDTAAATGATDRQLLGEGVPVVVLSVTGANMAEAGGAATVRATLSTATNVAVTVALAFSGTATFTSDYTRTGTNITIMAGNTTGTITLKAVQDARDETNETIVVSISSVSHAEIGTPSQVTATIIDDDAPPAVTLGFQTVDYLVEAQGTVALVASLSAVSELPVTVSFAFSGGAAFAEDYLCESSLVIAPLAPNGTLTLRGIQDSLLEGLETITVDVDEVQNGTESGTQRVTLRLVDDDQHWVGLGSRVAVWTNGLPADRIRFGVRDEGVYRVTAGEIAAASGAATNDVLAALVSRGLSLRCQRREIAWTTDGQSLFFFGLPTTELFAPENVYWLAFGPGTNMESFAATPEPGAQTNAWFLHQESYRPAFLAPFDPRDRRSSVGTLTNVSNFGEWIQGTTTEASRAKSRSVGVPGFCEAAGTGVTARVSLASYRDFTSPDVHACELWVNGTLCGTQGWWYEQAVTFDYAVAPGVVTNGPVDIKIRNGLTAQLNDFMLLDVALSYPCAYVARDGRLLCTGGGSQTAAAGGFGSDRLRVWDVTEADRPAELEAPVWQDTDGLWQVAFLCGGADARYAVFDEAEGVLEPSLRGVRDIDWSAPGEMPACAVVVPPRHWAPGFEASAQPLVDFRNAQGLGTRLIEAEELYNAFSDGLAHPAAFSRFCTVGVTNGAQQTLRYLLFAGYGGSDYKFEVFRLGELAPYPALFPLYQRCFEDALQFAALMLPNDFVLGEVVGGALPEVAVGRMLATNAVELAFMVGKTIGYELTEAWKSKAVFAADWQNTGDKYADFTSFASNTAVGFAEAGWAIRAFYPGPDENYVRPYWVDGAEPELQAGAGLFYYVGHSSDAYAGGSVTPGYYWFSSDIFKAATWAFPPVGLFMGCRMGRWTLLDLRGQQQCISEAAVRNRFSGFVVAISTAGYSTAGDAAQYSYAFSDAVKAGALRVGDAWRGAFERLGNSFASRYWHLTFLGDPALCLSATRTARGTSTSWLLDYRLTGDPYADLADQDDDGFWTWQEYQAGTSPTQAVVRIRAFASRSADGTGRPLTFEPIGGKAYRVVSVTNLVSGVWQALPWRPDASAAWSWSGIPVDWPLETVEVPVDPAEPRRFYKVVAVEE